MASQKMFDLILLDGQMPEMDGYMLAERIRETREFADIKIIMLTSCGTDGRSNEKSDLGINASLTKPIKQSELLNAIMSVVKGSFRGEPEPQESPEQKVDQCGRKLSLLLVEDNFINQKLAVELLELRGHNVAVAGNGVEALDALEEQEFDLVLMDVQMPEMDGFEATAAIRARETSGGRRLPIVAMTAHAMKGYDEKCFQSGMDGYISKPIRPDDLFRLIEELTSSSGGGSEKEDPAPAGDGSEEAVDLTAWDELPVIDRKEALERVLGKEALLKDIVAIFLHHAPSKVDEFDRLFAEGDSAGLEYAAHSFKGSLSTLSAKKASAVAADLERAAREEDWKLADRVFERLKEEVEVLRHEVADLDRRSEPLKPAKA